MWRGPSLGGSGTSWLTARHLNKATGTFQFRSLRALGRDDRLNSEDELAGQQVDVPTAQPWPLHVEGPTLAEDQERRAGTLKQCGPSRRGHSPQEPRGCPWARRPHGCLRRTRLSISWRRGDGSQDLYFQVTLFISYRHCRPRTWKGPVGGEKCWHDEETHQQVNTENPAFTPPRTQATVVWRRTGK